MRKFDTLTQAYIDAIYFTETGDIGQPDSDATLTKSTIDQAVLDCHKFKLACIHDDLISEFDPEQVGHDLWLTRNGHGVGFWDRPEVYGKDAARILTAMACAMGEHYAEFEEFEQD